jgi:hypothetical protein
MYFQGPPSTPQVRVRSSVLGLYLDSILCQHVPVNFRFMLQSMKPRTLYLPHDNYVRLQLSPSGQWTIRRQVLATLHIISAVPLPYLFDTSYHS